MSSNPINSKNTSKVRIQGNDLLLNQAMILSENIDSDKSGSIELTGRSRITSQNFTTILATNQNSHSQGNIELRSPRHHFSDTLIEINNQIHDNGGHIEINGVGGANDASDSIEFANSQLLVNNEGMFRSDIKNIGMISLFGQEISMTKVTMASKNHAISDAGAIILKTPHGTDKNIFLEHTQLSSINNHATTAGLISLIAPQIDIIESGIRSENTHSEQDSGNIMVGEDLFSSEAIQLTHSQFSIINDTTVDAGHIILRAQQVALEQSEISIDSTQADLSAQVSIFSDEIVFNDSASIHLTSVDSDDSDDSAFIRLAGLNQPEVNHLGLNNGSLLKTSTQGSRASGRISINSQSFNYDDSSGIISQVEQPESVLDTRFENGIISLSKDSYMDSIRVNFESIENAQLVDARIDFFNARPIKSNSETNPPIMELPIEIPPNEPPQATPVIEQPITQPPSAMEPPQRSPVIEQPITQPPSTKRPPTNFNQPPVVTGTNFLSPTPVNNLPINFHNNGINMDAMTQALITEPVVISPLNGQRLALQLSAFLNQPFNSTKLSFSPPTNASRVSHDQYYRLPRLWLSANYTISGDPPHDIIQPLKAQQEVFDAQKLMITESISGALLNRGFFQLVESNNKSQAETHTPWKNISTRKLTGLWSDFLLMIILMVILCLLVAKRLKLKSVAVHTSVKQ